MSSTINRRHFALLLTLGGMAGCASAQSQPPSMPIIDKLPLTEAHFGRPVKLLGPDEYKENQQALLSAIEEQLHGMFLITAQRILLFPTPTDVGQLISPQVRMGFNSIMYKIDENAELIFENDTIDNPYINIWKTGEPTPEYTLLCYYLISKKNRDILLGYFQLKPTEAETKLYRLY